MVGAICTMDVLAHPVLIIQAFGWRVFFRAVLVGHGQTFLSLLERERCFASPDGTAPDEHEPALIQRCMDLELQAKRIYESLAERFAASLPLNGFLTELAAEEEQHAELLGVCREAALKAASPAGSFRPWHDYVPILEQQMEELERSLPTIDSMDDAVQLVTTLEASEINRVFLGIIDSSDARFVRKLKPFRRAIREHIRYICRVLPLINPQALLASRELRAKYLWGG